MEPLTYRMRTALRRVGDRIQGRHVPIVIGNGPVPDGQGRRWAYPAVDVYENDQEVLVQADVPGASPQNTELRLDVDQGLILHVQAPAEPEGQPLVREQPVVDWYQVFRLPDYVDAEASRSTVREGVITVHLPKKAAPEPIPIPVRAG